MMIRWISAVMSLGVLLGTLVSWAEHEGFRIQSSAFKEGQSIPIQYTCKGQNINPPLTFEGIPAQAKSVVLVMDDPDAPMGTWQHWLMWNVPTSTKAIESNSVPSKAVNGKNSSGNIQYAGPCPPFGTHRYYFRAFALDTTLTLQPGSKRSALDKAIKGHVLEEAVLMGRFKK